MGLSSEGNLKEGATASLKAFEAQQVQLQAFASH